MGPTHNNQNGPGGALKKGGLVKITTPVQRLKVARSI